MRDTEHEPSKKQISSRGVPRKALSESSSGLGRSGTPDWLSAMNAIPFFSHRKSKQALTMERARMEWVIPQNRLIPIGSVIERRMGFPLCVIFTGPYLT